jgi:hypothetical protein
MEAINKLYKKLVETDATGDTADHAAAEAIDHTNKKLEGMDTARASTSQAADNCGQESESASKGAQTAAEGAAKSCVHQPHHQAPCPLWAWYHHCPSYRCILVHFLSHPRTSYRFALVTAPVFSRLITVNRHGTPTLAKMYCTPHPQSCVAYQQFFHLDR